MNIKAAWLATALSLTLAATAHAASTDFSHFGTQYAYDGTAGWSDGGVTLTYVGSPGQIYSTALPDAYSWYVPGSLGYTDISLTGGGTFTDVSLLLGTGYGGSTPWLAYALVSHGTVLATGDWMPLPNYGDGLVTANFGSNQPITDLWIQAPPDAWALSPDNLDALLIAQVTLTGAVPEPAGGSLALLGLGAVALAARRHAQAKGTR